MTGFHETIRKYLDEKRSLHSINTAAEALKLAKKFGCDEEKAYAAGMLHDIAKCLDKNDMFELAKKYNIEIDKYCKMNKELFHGILGAEIARNELQITDEEVLNAIRCHTTGKKDMTLLDKIIYIADLIEPLRDFKGIEAIRRMAYEDLDEAVVMAARSIMQYVMEQGHVIHPNTVDAYNDLLIKRRNTVGKKVYRKSFGYGENAGGKEGGRRDCDRY